MVCCSWLPPAQAELLRGYGYVEHHELAHMYSNSQVCGLPKCLCSAHHFHPITMHISSNACQQLCA